MNRFIVSITLILTSIFTVNAQLFGPPKFKAGIMVPPTCDFLYGVENIAVLKFQDNSNPLTKKRHGDFGDDFQYQLIAELSKDYRGTLDKVHNTQVSTKVFKIIDRDKTEEIMEELRLSLTGLVDENQLPEIGKMLGAEVLLTGDITYTVEENTYYKTNKKEVKEKIKETVDRVRTETTINEKGESVKKEVPYQETIEKEVVRTVIDTIFYRDKVSNIVSNIKVTDIETAEVLNVFSKQSTQRDVKTNKKSYPVSSNMSPTASLVKKGIDAIVVEFANCVTPRYVTFSYKPKKVKSKKKAIKEKVKLAQYSLKNDNLDDGFAIYQQLYLKDNYNPALAYNLGLLHEAVGNFEDALVLYKNALSLDDDDKNTLIAYARVQEKQEKKKDLESMGIVVPKYVFDKGTFNQNVATLEVKGSSKSRVEVYANPDKYAQVIAEVPGGIDLSVLEKVGSWYKVKLIDGKEGYIAEKNGSLK